ncbi:MAG: hypothetical protein HY000_15285 [Planctomycetes bacterium]|nr:hypothetical protein [Planctomycetota bacterium]
MTPLIWLQRLGEDVRQRYAEEYRILGTLLEKAPSEAVSRKDLARLGLSRYGKPDRPKRLVMASFHAMLVCHPLDADRDLLVLSGIAKLLLRRKLPFGNNEVSELLTHLTGLTPDKLSVVPVGGVLDAVARVFRNDLLSLSAKSLLETLRGSIVSSGCGSRSATQKLLDQIDRLCNDSITSRLSADGGWADAVQRLLTELDGVRRDTWESMLWHLGRVTPEPPAASWELDPDDLPIGPDFDAWSERRNEQLLARSAAKSWLGTANDRIEQVGREEFVRRLIGWLGLVPRSRPGLLARECANREMLRGLLWCCCELDDRAVVQAVALAADALYKKKSGLGTAAVQVLFHVPGRLGAMGLAKLVGRVRAQSHKELIRTALRLISEREGISVEELEEIDCPTYGFTEVGIRRERFDDYTAELAAAN